VRKTEKKRTVAVSERAKRLTSVVTSRLRYSIHTRMGEFIDAVFLCSRYDGNLGVAVGCGWLASG
jgi:hypothetical protein